MIKTNMIAFSTTLLLLLLFTILYKNLQYIYILQYFLLSTCIRIMRYVHISNTWYIQIIYICTVTVNALLIITIYKSNVRSNDLTKETYVFKSCRFWILKRIECFCKTRHESIERTLHDSVCRKYHWNPLDTARSTCFIWASNHSTHAAASLQTSGCCIFIWWHLWRWEWVITSNAEVSQHWD